MSLQTMLAHSSNIFEISCIVFLAQVNRDSRSDSEESADEDSDGKEARPDDKVVQNGKKKL
jgi:hypothetical protein